MITLQIEGMTCGHCAMTIKHALAAVPGVTGQVEVSLSRGQAVVPGSPAVASLVAAVAAEGYLAQVVD
jgi:copper chaperone